MSSQNDGTDAGPEGPLSGAGIKVEYHPGDHADQYGVVIPGYGYVGFDSAKPQGYSIGASSLEDGGSSSEDGEIGEPIWSGGPVPAESVSVFGQVGNTTVDVDGDALSPQALQQMAQDWKSMTLKLSTTLMPANQLSWLDAAKKKLVKRTIKPVLKPCPCGAWMSLQDIKTDPDDMTHLNVIVRCTGCKTVGVIPFQPQGDEQVGPSYDAVAISYFKKTEGL